MTEPSTTTIPGWYPDPAAEAGLRFWDGTRWARDVRPAPDDVPPGWPSDDLPPVTGPPERQRNYATFVLAVFILVFAVGGFYEVLAGNSSSNSNPNRFAADAAGSTVPTTVPTGAPTTQVTPQGVDCTGPAIRFDAVAAVAWMAGNGLPVLAIHPRTPSASPTSTGPTTSGATLLPAGSPCSHAAFGDARANTVNEMWGYRNGFEALHALSDTQVAGSVTFTDGPYVTRLDARLAPFRADYEAALRALVTTQTQVLTQPTPTTLPGPLQPGRP